MINQRAAQESLVLLQNAGGDRAVLPLEAQRSHIAVVGPHANATHALIEVRSQVCDDCTYDDCIYVCVCIYSLSSVKERYAPAAVQPSLRDARCPTSPDSRQGLRNCGVGSVACLIMSVSSILVADLGEHRPSVSNKGPRDGRSGL